MEAETKVEGLDVNDLRVWKEDCHPGLARSTCAGGSGVQERDPGEKLGNLLPYGMVEGLKAG